MRHAVRHNWRWNRSVEADRATLRSHVLASLAEVLLSELSHLGALLLRRNYMYKNTNCLISLTRMCQC